MKHMIRKVIIVLSVLLSAFVLLSSCGDGAKTAGSTENEPGTAPDSKEANKYTVWMTNGYKKYGKNTPAPEKCDETVSLSMAKNETESFQFMLSLDESKEKSSVMLALDGCENGLTAELYRVGSVETKLEYFCADPLIPYDGEAAEITPGETSAFFIRLKASKDAVPGDRTLSLKLKNGAGEVMATYPVSVHVRSFALPDAYSCVTATGLNKANISNLHQATDESEIDELYRAYYDLLLDFKMSAYDLPYDILDERADEYMSDPRVTSFRIPDSVDDDIIRAYYDKLSQNPVWLDKAYFYPLDEPTTKEMLDELKEKTEHIRSLFPNARICTPFFVDIDYDDDTDQIDFMTGITDLWCPKAFMYKDSNVYDEAKAKKYPSFEERMLERKAEGDDVWWYVCWEPGSPYCNLFIDQSGLMHRLLFWQQKYYGVDGFLYWCSNYWTEKPWEDMATVKWLSPSVFGDGALLYNGSEVGLDTGCPSMRLAAVCDGAEDFDLLTLAEQYLGKEHVCECIASVSSSLTEYTKDSAEFDSVRQKLGDELEAAIG